MDGLDGLLGFVKTPEGQGLLSAAFGGLAGARRGQPMNSLGRAGLAGIGGYGQALDRQDRTAQEAQERQLRTMQIQQAQDQMQDKALDRTTAQRFYTPATEAKPGLGLLNDSLPPEMRAPAVAPVAAKPAAFDLQGYAQARMGQNPTAGLALMQAIQKETPINKLDVKDYTPASVQKFAQTKNYGDLVRMDKLHFADTGGTVAGLDPFTGKPVSTSAKTGNPFSDLVVGDGAGGLAPNSPLIAAKTSIAKAGASNTNLNVNTEKSFLGDVAGGVGKAVVDARGGAQSALGTIATVNRLTDALDSGKVMAGPGTTFRQYGLQVGSMLGIAGKDANEKLLNTRQAIQSLAQLELDGAQQMKGQGQITEAERSIIKRAASGDVDGMTTGELRLLGGVLERSARTKIRGYNSQIKPLLANPHAAPIAPFMAVEEPAERTAPNVLRFDAQGNALR